jgi:F0F1-type ATP synthase membrane subunit a
LLPFDQMGLRPGGSPTADLNTTAAFASAVYLGIWFVAVKRRGLRACAHLGAMRLAFNMMAGDLLLFVVGTIIAANVTIGSVHLSIFAAIVPFGVEFFNFSSTCP